ncbi:hypothetical protein ACSOSW_07315 [Micrococcus luteus KDCGSN]|uniref:hypothetical protein n=1 Tax=Micrococcus luteus TaxID=1270 RepID=UPI003EED56F5
MKQTTRPSRAIITERDALYLAFLSRFPAADAEALSYLATRAENPFGADTSALTSPSGITKRMLKLVKMGAVTRHRHILTGRTHYGVTEFGWEAARHYGHEIAEYRGLQGLHISTLEHHRAIALIAAQFASPVGIYRDALGIDPVPMDHLVSEKEIDRAYSRVRTQLNALKDSGKTATFADYRRHVQEAAGQSITEGSMDARTIMTTHPALWTVAAPKDSDRYRHIQKPDLALHLDPTRREPAETQGKNWLIEIELSPKTSTEYDQTMRTLRAELSSGSVYERIVYFVGNDAIGRAIREADKRTGANLTDLGRLTILDISARTPAGAPRKPDAVTVDEPRPVTVDAQGLPEPDTVPHTRGLPRRVPTMPNARVVVGGE